MGQTPSLRPRTALMMIGSAAKAQSAEDGPDHVWFPEKREIRAFTAVKHLAQAHADPGKDNRAGDNSQNRGKGKVEESDTDQRRASRLATKNGTAGTRRSKKSTISRFPANPVLSFFSAPSEASILAANVAPNPQRAARKIATAPVDAAMTLNTYPASDRIEEPACDRCHCSPGQRKRHNHDIDRDENERRDAQIVGIPKRQQRLAVVAQGFETSDSRAG